MYGRAWEDLFQAWEDVGEESGVAGLAFEELGGKFLSVAAAAMEDDGVSVRGGGIDGVGAEGRRLVWTVLWRCIGMFCEGGVLWQVMLLCIRFVLSLYAICTRSLQHPW